MKKKSVDVNVSEEKVEQKKKESERSIRWERLDNTAHLFPVIAGESMTNVYRISVTLNELIQPDLLQVALNMILPKFDGFNLRLQMGVFWYYFEENDKPAPTVKPETKFPCRFITAGRNRRYLFRVTYYKYRINLEVFHALTDGMGGINFLNELTYQYLRLAHPDLKEQVGGDAFSSSTSLSREDSFLKNYRKSSAKKYKTQKAYQVKGEKLRPGEFGVMHGYMKIPELKAVCKSYGVSINEYFIGCYVWSVYKECLHGMPSKNPIRVAVPVNLRPYFNSNTTKNFFVMVSAEFLPTKEEYEFGEVLQIIRTSLRSQINKEHLEELFSYNVSNEKILLARAVPLVLKNIAMSIVYSKSAYANTTTFTNIGNITVEEAYRPYIDMFHAFLPMSKGQNLKGTICSFGDTMAMNFSYVLKDTSIQRCFFRKIAEDGIAVEIETNGATYE
ncbi:MAG: hypothetical protein IKL06_02955 [Lachnospiraceae bacterium]|nr:hypothetical protein [Lachnospiraceae bacterium]